MMSLQPEVLVISMDSESKIICSKGIVRSGVATGTVRYSLGRCSDSDRQNAGPGGGTGVCVYL